MVLLEVIFDMLVCVVSFLGNQLVWLFFMECVQMIKEVQKVMDDKRFDEVIQFCGGSFENNWNIYKFFVYQKFFKEKFNFFLVILNVGVLVVGMNVVVCLVVWIGIFQGYMVYVVYDGFEGLVKGQV